MEELSRPLLSQLFGDIHEFAAAVVSSARVALGIFVGQHGTLGLEHRLADKILRSDEFELSLLTFFLSRITWAISGSTI